MTTFNLAAMTRRASNPRRSRITIKELKAPAIKATDLYRACYAPIVAHWQDVAAQLQVPYERALSSLTTDSPDEMGAILDGAEQSFTILLFGLTASLRQFTLRTERWQRDQWSKRVLSATQVDLSTMLGADDVKTSLDLFIQRNVDLIKDISQEARRRIGSAVFDGLRARKPARDVAKQISDATGMVKRRAVNVASDQLSKITSALQSERRRQAGIDTWVWVSSHKLHFREEHLQRDGKEYSDENPPPTMPGEEVNCACSERAVLKLD